MDAAPDNRRQLGQIMVDEGFLTENQLQDALAEQDRTGTPIGKVLVDLGFVSPGAVANALAEQHGGLLRTEYGTSAGLREMNGRPPIRTDAPPPAPAPTSAAALPQAAAPTAPLGAGLRLAGHVPEAPAQAEAPPAPAPVPEPQLQVAPALPEPELPVVDESSARIEELESQLHTVLTERNSLTQSFNELQARLSDAAQAHEAGVSAEVNERVGALESQLQAVAASRDELDRELQELRPLAAGRDAALEQTAALAAELEQLRSRGDDGLGAQLHELGERRDAAEARAHALESDLAQLREHLDAALQSATAEKDSETARAAAFEAELAALREQSTGPDDGLVAHVSGLEEAVQGLTAERDAAVARAAALEPELASLRDRIRDASTPASGSTADVAELRQQLAARERRLAESVGEIAKMNREHRALLQLVERQFQLEESSTSVPEPKHEGVHVLFVPAATGYTLVERDGAAPDAGDVLDLDGGRFVVRRLGPSPLPGPGRRCAYLERA